LAEICGSDAIDSVYVASPIGAHFEHVMSALSQGKHVLCEKTLATSPAEVREMFDSSADHGRVLLEAVRPVHDPAYQVIAAATARLGTLRHAHLEKCQYSSRYPAYLRGQTTNAFDPASGNAALRDIGVYCLQPSLTLFGAPQDLVGRSYRLDNGFEAGGTLVLGYGAMSVTCTYSKVSRSVTPSVIEGEEGTLTIDSVAEPANVSLFAIDGREEKLLSGPTKRPDETLHHPIEQFLTLCEGGSVSHRFREQSILAEELMTRALHGHVAGGPAIAGAADRRERP